MNTSERVFVQLVAYGCVALISGALAAYGLLTLGGHWLPRKHPL